MKMATRVCLVVAVAGVLLTGSVATSSRSDVTIETDASSYCTGDTVWFTFTNHSDSLLWINNIPGWWVWDVSGDTLIYPLNVLWMMWWIDPDSSVTDCWTQIDYHLNQVPQGKYCVKINGTLGNGGGNAADADTFSITGATPVSGQSWSSVKSNWR